MAPTLFQRSCGQGIGGNAMRLGKALKQIYESKFSVGQKTKMMPNEGEGVRPIPVEIIQVLKGRCKVLILDGKRKGEELIVWNSKLGF